MILSDRQYPMLEVFYKMATDGYMSIEEAHVWDQRPFRSMLIRKWVEYKANRGFRITKEGRAAWTNYHQTDIIRKNPSAPLTAYFDPAAYGIAAKKQRLHVVSRRA